MGELLHSPGQVGCRIAVALAQGGEEEGLVAVAASAGTLIDGYDHWRAFELDGTVLGKVASSWGKLTGAAWPAVFRCSWTNTSRAPAHASRRRGRTIVRVVDLKTELGLGADDRSAPPCPPIPPLVAGDRRCC